MYAQIVFPKGLDKTLTYLVPESFEKDIKVGQRVLVPLEKRTLSGFVVGISSKSDVQKLKSIVSILEFEPVFSKEILSLCEWVSEYYFCSLRECLKATLPSQLSAQTKSWVKLNSSKDKIKPEKVSLKEKKILELLEEKNQMTVSSLKKKLKEQKIYHTLKSLQEKKLIHLFYAYASRDKIPKFKARIKKEIFYVLKKPDGLEDVVKYFEEKISVLEKKAPKQASCLKILLKGGEISQKELKTTSNSTNRILKKLEEKNLVEAILKEENKSLDAFAKRPELFDFATDFDLDSSQKEVCEKIKDAIDQNIHKVFLLFGDRTSEKTKIYLKIVKEVLKKGKSALVLVPEITLTPKTILFFKSYLGKNIGCLHSKLSLSERFTEWERIKNGEVRVVVGPRSAVFAPLTNLGLIVVDDEHDPSFKQEDQNPRYNARDVAVMRAKINNCVAILGSAIPSVESFFNAQKKKYTLLQLQTEDYMRSFPQVKIVDMRKEREGGNFGYFSKKLSQLLEENIKKNQKVILFLNRRGFSKVVKCQDCGYVFRCPNCDISLTFHLADRSFRCHYCGYIGSPQNLCPACKSFKLSYKGVGIERIEEEIKKYHPQILLGRIDSDTIKSSHLKTLSDFGESLDAYAKKFDLLLGTQMIIKSLELPDISLVGVISADFGLDFPDFRAREKTFQLLFQMIEKAKRNGEVIIQTYYPSDWAIKSVSEKNFSKFFANEIKLREELDYPPFTHLILIKFSGENHLEVKKVSQSFGKILKKRFISEKISEKRILGPALAFKFRLKGKSRYQILVKAKSLKKILKLLRSAFEDRSFKRKKSIRISVNVDPLEIV